jgi:hypothetical protein
VEVIMKKKTMIRISTMALAMLFTAVLAQAQGVNSYRAHVPFDFMVGEKSYDAGDYLIRFEQQGSLATIFTLSTAQGRELQASAVMKNGRTSRSGTSVLVFDRYGDNYILRQISSPAFGFWAPKVDAATWVTITKNLKKDPQTVSVVLAR